LRSTAWAAFLVATLALMVTGASASPTGAAPVHSPACSAVQNPSGDLLVTSDLPLHGATRSQALQMSEAIAFVFEQSGWMAGTYSLAYQSCDDSTARDGEWTAGACSANATSYANDASVVAVVGPSNSGCAAIEIPIENRAPSGPLAMVSPANTYVGLTHSAPGTTAAEPGAYYPTGTRSYARVIAADDVQAAADAVLASQLKVTKLFVVNDRSAYGAGIATDMANAAKRLGIRIVTEVAWDPSRKMSTALAVQIKASGAQAVFLGGLISAASGQLLRDIRVDAPTVTILAPDGFTPISADLQQSGGQANGMYVSVAGLPNEKLPPAGKKFVKAFSKSIGGATVEPNAVYAAQAAEVVIQAIAKSDGTRASVASSLFKVKIRNGLLGPISFNANGDVPATPVTIYKVTGGKPATYTVIVPTNSLVAAA
jgi:branched-chain amino acid transport system substrate-binding protein